MLWCRTSPLNGFKTQAQTTPHTDNSTNNTALRQSNETRLDPAIGSVMTRNVIYCYIHDNNSLNLSSAFQATQSALIVSVVDDTHHHPLPVQR